MHRGFNFKPFKNSFFDKYLEEGLVDYVSEKINTTVILENYLINDDFIDGSKMQEDWFPLLNKDVFISHSHKDEDKAIALAGWLKNTFNLSSFIDSCVWGYANDLLKDIDNTYCVRTKKPLSYSYNSRNYSTSHVHMMLSTALMKMMDKTECLIFINTDQSITSGEIIEQTESPWIYSEITMSQLLKENLTGRESPDEKTKYFSEDLLTESLLPSFRYKSELSHLTKINELSLIKLQTNWNKQSKLHPLDLLYKLNPKPQQKK